MSDAPLLSVIIPAFNCAETLPRAIASARQIQPEPEIIVVDDGSSQNYDELQATFSHVRFIRHTQNMGLSQARKTGTEAANGQFILHLDADDYVLPAVISELLAKVVQHGYVLAIFGVIQQDEYGHQWQEDRNQLMDCASLSGRDLMEHELLCANSWIWHLCVNKLVARSLALQVYASIEVWPQLNMYEDLLWSLHLFSVLDSRTQICTTAQCGYVYIRHAESITLDKTSMRQQQRQRDMQQVFSLCRALLDQRTDASSWQVLFSWREQKAREFCGLPGDAEPLSVSLLNQSINMNALRRLRQRLTTMPAGPVYLYGKGELADRYQMWLDSQSIQVKGYLQTPASIASIPSNALVIIGSVGSFAAIVNQLRQINSDAIYVGALNCD